MVVDNADLNITTEQKTESANIEVKNIPGFGNRNRAVDCAGRK